MNLARIAVCDDDSNFINEITRLLQQVIPFQYELFCYSDGQSVLTRLEEHNQSYDIVLLDIEMPGVNGLVTAKRLKALDPGIVVVLVTTHGEFVYEGYRVRAFQFLVKPLNTVRFQEVMEDALEEVRRHRTQDSLFVEQRDTITAVQIRDIICASVKQSTITLTCEKAPERTISTISFHGSMSQLRKQLEPKGFFLIHRSQLVNLRYIVSIDKVNRIITLKYGITLDVSTRKINKLYDAFARYFGVLRTHP